MRWIKLLLVLLWVLPVGIAAQSPNEGLSPRLAGAAATAVSSELEIQQTLLDEDLVRYERLVRKRDVTDNRLSKLRRSLEAAVTSGVRASPEQMDALLEQVGQAEAERAELVAQEKILIQGIRDRRRKIGLLEERIEALEGRASVQKGVLTGDWDVVLLPLEQRGVFQLQQTGTLINGTYQLSGGWSGSLQGTLVNRKVYLVRIDSKLGRMMELEGYLSTDGEQIRGDWLNYELAGGDGSTGQWSARRRNDTE